MSEIEHVLLGLCLDVTFKESIMLWELYLLLLLLLLSLVERAWVLVDMGVTEILFTGTGPLQYIVC
jgi:hypothetical protein